MASAPSPRPGTALGSGKTQKTGSSSATNSAAASICAAQANAAAGPRGRVPAPPGARPEPGSIPGRRRSFLVRFALCPPTGAFSSTDKEAEARRRNGEKRQDLLGGRRLGRTPASDSAGVWHRGPRRKALAQLRAGLHLSEDGNSPCHPAPRRAPRCHGTERRRHAPHCRLCPGGSLCPPLLVRLLPHRPHPVTSAALRSFLFDTSTGYSSVCVLPPPSAHVLLPLPRL